MRKIDEIDIIIPVSIELDWPTRESVVKDILEQNEKFGFKRFALACPSGGWRAYGYPSVEHYIEKAELFKQIKEDLLPYGIDCGWWITATLKSGRRDDFSPVVRPDGSESPIANCPMDPIFKKEFAKRVSIFAKIAKPSFIITEDDYSLIAVSSIRGCFCENHIKEFSNRMGREFTRESLMALFTGSDSKKGYYFAEWQRLMKDSLVILAKEIRQAVDIDSPEIPIGYMQAGNVDREGDATFEIAKALAGENHIPFTRFFGVSYGNHIPEKIPGELYHAIYCKQHIKGDYIFYHESDTYPHTKFFTAASQMKTIMSIAYSHGFDGSTFQTQQLLDCPNEEKVYGEYFNKERNRFIALHKVVKQCENKGVELMYNPTFNTTSKFGYPPHWVMAISLFGIPWRTTKSNIAFLDKNGAKNLSDDEIMGYLSKVLFMDGETAKILCDRGFSRYLGVTMGEDLALKSKINYDLANREIIREKYICSGEGRNMPSPYMFSISWGKMLEMKVENPACEIITDLVNFKQEVVNTGMIIFENELGGTMFVMSMTVEDVHSHSLLNYRRQRLFQRLITKTCDELVYAKEAARIYLIQNEAKDEQQSGFKGQLTLINLSSDTCKNLELHLPNDWKNREYLILNEKADWEKLSYEATKEGIILKTPLNFQDPVYILCK